MIATMISKRYSLATYLLTDLFVSLPILKIVLMLLDVVHLPISFIAKLVDAIDSELISLLLFLILGI
jgi:hypothetical protein